MVHIRPRHRLQICSLRIYRQSGKLPLLAVRIYDGGQKFRIGVKSTEQVRSTEYVVNGKKCGAGGQPELLITGPLCGPPNFLACTEYALRVEYIVHRK